MRTILAATSCYSLQYGVHTPREWVTAAKAAGYGAVGIADRGNLYGVHGFLSACREAAVKPLIGAELDGILLIAKEMTGFRNLSRLITAHHLKEGPFLSLLPSHHEGLVVITADPEHLSALKGAVSSLYRRICSGRDIVADGIAPVVAPPLLCRAAGDLPVQRLLRTIAAKGTVAAVPDRPASGFTLPEYEAQVSRLDDLSPEGAANRAALVAACTIDRIDHGFVFPRYPVEDPDRLLKERAYDGALRRYGELPEAVVLRLEFELDVISRKRFTDYFLAVADIVEENPRICGRGSGAASIVAYSLGITNVDPIRHRLYFERFLHPERSDPPDIDIDFAWDERDAAIDKVMAHFGRDHTAMVCVMQHYRSRAALRETARAFGMPDRETSEIERKLDEWRMQGSVGNRPSFDPAWENILTLAKRITGLPSHIGVHPGGIVITPAPVRDYCPVEMAPKGVPILQWDKDDTEACGLVKIDLLGNRSLAVIRDALADITAAGTLHDETAWSPLDDVPTQELLSSGRTMGIFYIESPAMRQLQEKTRRGDFEHIVIHSSIIRPAANKLIGEYIRRLKGKGTPSLHPVLDAVLGETYGIMVYQEDVSKCAVALVGFSEAEGDSLRKVLSKKDREQRLPDFKERFFAGARKNGVGDEVTSVVWDMILSFDGYSFCKPHSASYAMVSFQSGWLKAHHPASFIAAVIGNGGGFYGRQAYISEARRMGLTVTAPEVNESGVGWHGVERTVRPGLTAIGGLSGALPAAIVAERERGGRYVSLDDLRRRVALTPQEAELLVYAGACDALEPGLSRPRQLWKLVGPAGAAQQGSLFGAPDTAAPEVKEPPKQALLERQFQILGFLPDRHPLALFRKELTAHETTPAVELPRLIGKMVRLAGWLVTMKPVRTSDGKTMAFATFEDETAIYETVLFPETFAKYAWRIRGKRPNILFGRVTEDEGAVMVEANKLETV
ncbi:MAG TPA: DNA polymerase III subunit alpha [bacterium]|nr:DNA polymerase III subunit alpha [bacterium]